MFTLRSTRRFRLLVPLAALLLAPGAGAESLPGPIPATVVRVIDGDTVEVRARIWLDQEVTTGVRLAGVDAPEIRQPDCAEERALGEAAKTFVEGLALQDVTLVDVDYDKYARRVGAQLILADGSNLSDLVLEAGHAVPYGAPDPWCAPPPAAAAAGR